MEATAVEAKLDTLTFLLLRGIKSHCAFWSLKCDLNQLLSLKTRGNIVFGIAVAMEAENVFPALWHPGTLPPNSCLN